MSNTQFDLVVRGATIVDGTGAEPFRGDVAVLDGIIAEVGEIAGRGIEELDASDLIATPGFVDIHTHYDGQVTWENRTSPSSGHGVTTVLMGNCGVGFAPCRPGDREDLVHLMEGIEDIPEIVMAEGLPWTWETYPEYLDVIGSTARDIDIASQLPHSALRVYVMGSRGLNGEAATPADLEEMKRLSTEAMTAGALGFGTSRTLFHRSSDGKQVPTKTAHEEELLAIAQGMGDAGHGVIQAVVELLEEPVLLAEIEMLGRVAQRSGRPASYSLVQMPDADNAWRAALDLTADLNANGVSMKAQALCRGNGVLLGLDLSYNPFSLHPSYREIADLPLAEKVAALREPHRRSRILAEAPTGDGIAHLSYLTRFDRMFSLGTDPDYEPDLRDSFAARAARLGISPQELAYDTMLESEGAAIIFLVFANYNHGNLDVVGEMIRDPNALLGLGDGGAHYGMVCDSSYTTFLLSYWVRDREHDRLSLAEAVQGLTQRPAEAIGLYDRGRIAPGYKADLNIIDLKRLALQPPRTVRDLPSGGRRLVQDAEGYIATIVGGAVTQRNGRPTDALPGRLVRGPQAAPAERTLQ